MSGGKVWLDGDVITRRHILQTFAAFGGSSLVMGAMDSWGLMRASAAQRPRLQGCPPGTRVIVLGRGPLG
ncbi:MAG: hypothetical protein VX453_03350 [Acidobacteriota bacterium]|nr:hypothetical protein [Acidobacteriota bacterium]